MRVAVMGAGALGGYFGGRLATAGHEVTLIARGTHLDALRRNGLTIRSPKGDAHIPDIEATDDPGDVGPVDVIIFAVKNQDVDASAKALVPVLGRDTWAITVQNGVRAPERLAEILGNERVVPGVVRMPGDISAPGVIRHSANFDFIHFGELDGQVTERVKGFRDALVEAGCMAEISTDIRTELWRKFTMQASFASVSALTRLDVGVIRESSECSSMFHSSMKETAAVAQAVLPDLGEDLSTAAWDFIQKVPPKAHASMLDDLNRGKPIEIDYLSGEVVRLGRKHGVPTPIHGFFLASLAPFRYGAPG
ncbi:2-dehydropantoate 2-reductase [Rhodovulum sp. YNF3179]|uniref:2-dehydropantoate 2-reductase n=1 Tax=Rhodovulum sp. YNF3179 TaxID=3425127 RepID=UPI003D329AE1